MRAGQRARAGAVAGLVVTLFMVAPVLGAAEAGPPAPPSGDAGAAAVSEITLDQALAMARRANRSLVVERARLAQTQASVEQAWSALFPTIAVQGRYTRNYKKFEFGNPAMPAVAPLLIQPVDQLDGTVSGTVPILVPAAYPALQAVKKTALAAEANVEANEATLLFSVAQTFYAAAASEEVLVTRRSSIEVARATLKNAQARFAAATVTKVDVDRAEIALVRAQQMEREARHGREQLYRTLGTLIQAPGPFRTRVRTEAPEAVRPPPVAPGEVDSALQLRPEFRALRLTLESAESQRRAQAFRWFPSLSAFGNARRFNYDNFARDRYSWALGGQLEWIIYDGGARDALRHQAAALAEEAQARAEVLRDNIRDDIANARGLIDTKASARDAAERAVALAKETLSLVRIQYEAGTVTQVDLLQAQDSLVAAEEALTQARFDVAVADLTFRRASGTFPAR